MLVFLDFNYYFMYLSSLSYLLKLTTLKIKIMRTKMNCVPSKSLQFLSFHHFHNYFSNHKSIMVNTNTKVMYKTQGGSGSSPYAGTKGVGIELYFILVLIHFNRTPYNVLITSVTFVGCVVVLHLLHKLF